MDITVLNSILAGLLLLIATVWVWYVYGRLWMRIVENEAQDAITAIDGLGLSLRPPSYRAWVVAEGTLDGRRVRVVWRGGVRGPHSVVRVGRTRRRLPLIRDAEGLRAALDGE